MGERFSVKSCAPSGVSLWRTTKPQKHCYRLFLRYQKCQFSASMCTVTGCQIWSPGFTCPCWHLLICLFWFYCLSFHRSQSSQQWFFEQEQPHLQLSHADQLVRRQRSPAGIWPAGRVTAEVRDHAVFRCLRTQVYQGGRGRWYPFFVCCISFFILSLTSFISILHTFSLFYPFLVVHSLVLFLSLFSSSFIISMSVILFLPLLRFVLPLPHILSNLLLCWLSVLFPSLFPSALYQSPVSCPLFITTHLFLSSHPLAETN